MGLTRGMCFSLVLVFLVSITIFAPSASAINGVRICGVNYNCGVADGVCPQSYDVNGSTCGVCDPDCGTCSENTPALCSDAIDNDGDGYTNYADAYNPGSTLNTAIGASCNIYNASTPSLCDPSSYGPANGVPKKLALGVSAPNSNQLPSPAVAYQWVSGTAASPGTATKLRLDPDGTGISTNAWCTACAAGYSWNAAKAACCSPSEVIGSGSSSCFDGADNDCNGLIDKADPACASVPDPSCNPSVTSFTATPSSGPASLGVTFVLRGNLTNLSTDAACGPGNWMIDTDGNLADGFEYNASGNTSTFTAYTTNGVRTLSARIQDRYGNNANATVTVTVSPDPVPVITSFTNSLTPKWGYSEASFSYTVTDNNPGSKILIAFGDGSKYATTAPGSPFSETILHNYTAGSYTATIDANDSANQPAVQKTITFTATSLPPVEGNWTGNQTYDNNATQCAADSCAAQNSAGWWSCYQASACYPSNNSICAGLSTPPTFVTRDQDQTACEAANPTCTMYTWTGLTNNCCGNDANEYLATSAYAPSQPGAKACCSQANQCYTTAGSTPGCFDGSENTLALCTDGLDNNCNGLVDGADPSCISTVSGLVTLLDENSNPSTRAGISVSAGNYTTTTAVDGSYQLTLPTKDNYDIYAAGFGFTREEKSLHVDPTKQYSLNFTLSPRRCNADCTNDEGLCDSSCIGVGACQPTGVEQQVMQACQPQGAAFGLAPGTEVVLDTNNATNEILVGVCCGLPPKGGAAQWRKAPPATAEGTDNIPTLVKFTRLVTLNGKTYQLVISTW